MRVMETEALKTAALDFKTHLLHLGEGSDDRNRWQKTPKRGARHSMFTRAAGNEASTSVPLPAPYLLALH